MDKITIKDLHALITEIEVGSKDRTRVISSIQNKRTKSIFSDYSELGMDAMRKKAVLETDDHIVGGMADALNDSQTDSPINPETLVGAGIGAGIATAVGAGATGAELIGMGMVAGSVVPGAGTLFGAAVGAGAVVFAKFFSKGLKNKKEIEWFIHAVDTQQDIIFHSYEVELNELRGRKMDWQMLKRLEYIVGVLVANEDLKKLCEQLKKNL